MIVLLIRTVTACFEAGAIGDIRMNERDRVYCIADFPNCNFKSTLRNCHRNFTGIANSYDGYVK